MKNLLKKFELNKKYNDDILLLLQQDEHLSNSRNKFFEKHHEINGYLRVISNKLFDYDFIIKNPTYFEYEEFSNKAIDSYLSIKSMSSLVDHKIESFGSEFYLKYFKSILKTHVASKQ